MDEDQIDSARNMLRVAAGLAVFGVFMGLRHYFLFAQGPLSVPVWFWFSLALTIGMLVGAVEFQSGLLEVYGVLIGAACSVLGAVLWGLVTVFLFFAFKLWQSSERAFDVLIARGPALMFAGFIFGAALTGQIVWSFVRDLLESRRASGEATDDDED